MAALFSDIPDAVTNTRLIADMCNVNLDFGKISYLPRFPVPEGYEVDGYFESLVRDGLENRKRTRGFFATEDEYRERLEFEIATIKKTGFCSYFLIVWDFINHAKKMNIPVGPGRGSGAGSLVAYSLNITDLDPIRYGLLFERFLNPERVSLPDIDTDFCEKRRGEVIEYVRRKYGENNVGQIVTFSQLNMKSIIKDVSRVLGFPYDVINKITKGIPSVVTDNDNPKKVTIDMALQLEPKLRELAERDPKFADVIEISRTLEGLNRQIGTHAAGVVIAERPLWEMVPVCHGKEKQFQTQYDMGDAEKAGLVKFDFLGLKTLTVIDNTLAMLREEGVEIDISELPMDDPDVYRLISTGETDGVFQLESGGFKEMLKRLKPTRFEEIVSATALHRPGPMKAGIEDDYIERKNGRKRITYPHPSAEPFLKETYGVIVYQEQVMQLSVALSGFTKGGADKLRKAMGKKNAADMATMGAAFVTGAVQRSGMAQEAAAVLWDQIQQFAGYAFNKSHSAAYSVVTYQTAWLKTHYPVHFMAALLSSEVGNPENIVNYIQAAKRMGIKVLPPDLNESGENFSVRGGKIRFGLLAVRGLGEAAIAEIIAARKKGGAFKSMLDFCNRVDLRRVTKKSMDMLIRGGALDFTGCPRAALAASLQTTADAAARSQKSRSVGQHSLFGDVQQDDVTIPDIGEWDEKDRLSAEKEALGFYVSGHPMEKYAAELRRYVSASISELEGMQGPAEVTLGGVVARLDVKTTKSGQGKMAVAAVEDLTGQAEVVIPPQVFGGAEAVLRGFEPVCLRCFLSPEQNEDEQEDEQAEGGQRKFKRTRLRAMQVLSMGDIRKNTVTGVTIKISMDELAGGGIQTLKKLVESHKGGCTLVLEIIDPQSSSKTVMAAGNAFKVSPEDSLVSDVCRAFPDAAVEFK
jgi:DNA polymerase-3 subunit alpha